MITKQMHQKNVIFVIFVIFHIKILRDLMQKAVTSNDIALVSIKGSDYSIHFWNTSANDTINIMKNSDLNEKSRLSCLFYYI